MEGKKINTYRMNKMLNYLTKLKNKTLTFSYISLSSFTASCNVDTHYVKYIKDRLLFNNGREYKWKGEEITEQLVYDIINSKQNNKVSNFVTEAPVKDTVLAFPFTTQEKTILVGLCFNNNYVELANKIIAL